MTKRNFQMIIAQSIEDSEDGVATIKNPTLSLGMKYIPSNVTFDVMLILDSVEINKESMHVKTWVERIGGDAIQESTIEFDISNNPNDNQHLGSNISRLQFINVPFEQEGDYKIVAQVDEETFGHNFRIFKLTPVNK
ncbi:hypothetical protein [Leuconostoc mesenteroides]|uniref:hypothetical protein n=1 Tax=Leuconostoc mesenteroides TaxID=1245 RepID=UPI0030D523A9